MANEEYLVVALTLWEYIRREILLLNLQEIILGVLFVVPNSIKYEVFSGVLHFSPNEGKEVNKFGFLVDFDS